MENMKGARLQHGPLAHRIYLMKLGDADPSELIPCLDHLAQQKGYTKIFAKVPSDQMAPFTRAGYSCEAEIPGFYNGETGVVFLGKYVDEQRAIPENRGELDAIRELAESKGSSVPLRPVELNSIFKLRPCVPADVEKMSELYRIVFPSYPFPIDDPAYLEKTMQTHVDYYGVESEGELVALSSAEKDVAGGNAEMTDFATLPDWRGHGLAFHLLRHMEPASAAKGIQTGYTIARAISPGMNITFAKCGYRFGGCLVNNTQIAGRIESMNVWYKRLSD